MFVASYHNTLHGSRHIFQVNDAEERAKRKAIQKAVWEAEVAAKEARIQRRQEAIDRSRAMIAELRAQGGKYRPSFHILEERTMALFGLSRSELRSNRRHRELVFARQFLMYWAVRLTNLSLPQIGRLMGGRDHTTCLHGKRVYPQKRAEMGRFLRKVR